MQEGSYLLPCVEHPGILLQEFQESTLRNLKFLVGKMVEASHEMLSLEPPLGDSPPDASIRDKTFAHL